MKAGLPQLPFSNFSLPQLAHFSLGYSFLVLAH